ncbi:MAG: cupin domain-containing protein [Candidatus Promineifilaceae bacterium]|nr:cupin domain-containing protein [Candidatus Promineifilaceae bacterium]
MALIKTLAEHAGVSQEKFFKTTLFRGDRLLLGLNCLEPGQVQAPHEHHDQDKFYYVVEGQGRFWLDDERLTATTGQLVWAPAGIRHGVENDGTVKLTLLMGIAPAPGGS